MAETISPKATIEENTNEDMMVKMMEQNLEGVMFHLFETDLYDLLKLPGFKALHYHQSQEETETLELLKHKYIEKYKKFPILKTKSIDRWEENEDLYKDLSEEKIISLVKESMKQYADWESEVLEHLLQWKRNVEDRKIVHKIIEDVMQEIKHIETLMDILEEHDYNYQCICEISDYLSRRYK